MIREINETDFDGLMRLYSQLHHDPIPERNETVNQLWSKILCDSAHHIIVAEEGGKILAAAQKPQPLFPVSKAERQTHGKHLRKNEIDHAVSQADAVLRIKIDRQPLSNQENLPCAAGTAENVLFIAGGLPPLKQGYALRPGPAPGAFSRPRRGRCPRPWAGEWPSPGCSRSPAGFPSP